MKTGIKAAAAALALSAATVPATAATLDFTFSWFESLATPQAEITGIVRGLTDNATSEAVSFEILTITPGSGYFFTPPLEFVSIGSNAWTVTNGEVTAVDFFGAADTDGDTLFEETIFFETRDVNGESQVLSAFLSSNLFAITPPDANVVTFELAAIPAPATILSLMAGLGAFAALGRRRPSASSRLRA